MMIVRLSGHPLVRDSLSGEDSVQQQHDGVVVVEEHGNPVGLRQAPRERRRTWERGRAAPELGCLLPSHPSTIYRWGERGPAPLNLI